MFTDVTCNYHFLGLRKLLLSCHQMSTFEPFFCPLYLRFCFFRLLALLVFQLLSVHFFVGSGLGSLRPLTSWRRSPVDVVLTSLAVVSDGNVIPGHTVVTGGAVVIVVLKFLSSLCLWNVGMSLFYSPDSDRNVCFRPTQPLNSATSSRDVFSFGFRQCEID